VSSVHVLAFSSSPPVISNFQLKLSPHPQCLWQHYRNEWYRRLIRSNRPLYRACPKHTKLLVSKAIVQAVEEQGGRFLERSRRTGMWYIVPYKRAVDKTSQGLRERDKDDDLAPVVTQLPASLQSSTGGKISKPNLKHLAQVTMAHAGMPMKPPPAASTSRLGGQAKQKQQQQKMHQQQMQHQQSLQQQNFMQQQQLNQQRGSFMNNMGGGMNMGMGMGMGQPQDQMNAPPSGLLSSQSSMFRILSRFGGGGGNGGRRQSFVNANNAMMPTGPVPMASMSGSGVPTMMGPGMMSNSMNVNQMGNANMSNMQGMNNMATMQNNMNPMGMDNMNPNNMGNMMCMNHMNNMGMSNVNALNNNMGGAMNSNNMGVGMNAMHMSHNMRGVNDMPMNQNSFPTNQAQFQQQIQMQQQQRQQQESQEGPIAPALTRLTTQVSDWLTSFWPVGKGPGQSSNTRKSSQQQQMMNNNNMIRGGGMDDNVALSAQLRSNQMGAAGIEGNNNNSSRRASRDDLANSIPPPGQLESSVSTTLLKLASSPSKILAGISTFFGNDHDGSTDQNSLEPDPLPPTGLAGTQMGRRQSKKSSDLLEDYEETEMEARMRAVAGGNNT